MRVLIDINHPAHVHFFKNLIWELQKTGTAVKIVVSDKDVAIKLLDSYNFKYTNIGSYGKTLISKFINLFFLDIKMLFVMFFFNPDLILGIGTIRGAHAGWLLRKTVLIFTDTEHASEQIALYKPFATYIYTPNSFTKDLGKKQRRYNGYHELAYLHPNRFNPDRNILNKYGISPDEKYFVLRFISWEATHDLKAKGFSADGKVRLIKELVKHGKVIISNEGHPPKSVGDHVVSIPPDEMHNLLKFASLYIGEGGTMASECAVIGTTSVLVNSLKAGTFEELENKYGLLHKLEDEHSLFSLLNKLISKSNNLDDKADKLERLYKDKQDVTSYMLDIVKSFSQPRTNLL